MIFWATIAALPAARRKIITTHDAFGYFGAAYGMQFIAPQGVSTEAGGVREYRAPTADAVIDQVINDLQEEFESAPAS